MENSEQEIKKALDDAMLRYVITNDARMRRRQKRALRIETHQQRYNQSIRTLIEQFRRESLICDLHVGWTSGHSGEGLDDEDLYGLIGKGGLMDILIDLLYRKRIDGVDVPQICANLLNDLQELEGITSGSICEASDIVKKTIGDFNQALRAYVKLEISKGHRSDDDPDDRIDNPMLIRLYLAANSGDYNPSHCEYHHGK